MNKKKTGFGSKRGKGSSARRPSGRPGAVPARRPGRPSPRANVKDAFRIIERKTSDAPLIEFEEPAPFRVLIAIHRPRFRGRAERAAALVGWQVTALLNKQDPVGQVAKPPRPPDLLVLSGDFGRQRDYAIFRAVQPWRKEGMKLIGLVDDCKTAPVGYPESVPNRLCDVCLEPPYKTNELRELFCQLYEKIRREPAPPPITRGAATEDEESEDEEE